MKNTDACAVAEPPPEEVPDRPYFAGAQKWVSKDVFEALAGGRCACGSLHLEFSFSSKPMVVGTCKKA